MAEFGQLNATLREGAGKRVAKRLRREGNVPGVYYHKDESPVGLQFELKEVQNLLAKRTPILVLRWGDSDDQMRECVIREVQYHPVTQLPMHIDLLGITRGVKMDATVRVQLVGTPVGVRASGGILQQLMTEVDIKCLPKDIPEYIEVDINNLELGDSIHLKDIQIEGIEWLTNPERAVVNVVPPTLRKEDQELEEGEEEEETEGEGEEAESEE